MYQLRFIKDPNHVHAFVYTPVKDGKTHTVTCSCGYYRVAQCYGQSVVGQIPRCSSCGWIISSPIGGEIIFSDEENNPLGYVYVDLSHANEYVSEIS